jgi:hypothetical protein
VSRRFSVTAGFYRTCVIDGLLEHSPAEHVRRPTVSPESPTLGFTHLQFEALLTTARESPNICDLALVAMLGLLGLRIFEATGADVMHTPDHTRRARHADGVVFLAFSSGSWSGSGGDVRIGQAWQWPMPVSASASSGIAGKSRAMVSATNILAERTHLPLTERR